MLDHDKKYEYIENRVSSQVMEYDDLQDQIDIMEDQD